MTEIVDNMMHEMNRESYEICDNRRTGTILWGLCANWHSMGGDN